MTEREYNETLQRSEEYGKAMAFKQVEKLLQSETNPYTIAKTINEWLFLADVCSSKWAYQRKSSTGNQN